MEKLEYREDVDYVMDKYGEQILKALEEQAKQANIIKRMYFIKENQYRDDFINKIKKIAEQTELNVDFAKIIAKNYIRESAFLGNEVEILLGYFKRGFNIGSYCYDALTAKDVSYRKHLKRKTLEAIECNVDEKGRIERVIDLIIDGILSVKLKVSKEGVKEKEFLTEEAQLVKLCESIYIVNELLNGIKKGSITEVHQWYDEMLKDIGIPEDFRNKLLGNNLGPFEYEKLRIYFYDIIYADIIKTSENLGKISMSDSLYTFINQMRGIVEKLHKKEETNPKIKEKIPGIKRLIEEYASFLDEDNNYYLKGIINEELSVDILGSFKKSEFFELLRFLSFYTLEEYEDIKKSLNEIRNREWNEIKGICEGKNFQQAMQSFESKIKDAEIPKYKYERMKQYLDIYLTYGRPKKMPEYLKKDKSIAYEFAIRFLSTKTPEQLLDLVKRLEEYEKCENSFKGLEAEGELKE